MTYIGSLSRHQEHNYSLTESGREWSDSVVRVFHKFLKNFMTVGWYCLVFSSLILQLNIHFWPMNPADNAFGSEDSEISSGLFSSFLWWNITFWFPLGICSGFSLAHGSWGKVFGLENVAPFVGVVAESCINHWWEKRLGVNGSLTWST